MANKDQAQKITSKVLQVQVVMAVQISQDQAAQKLDRPWTHMRSTMLAMPILHQTAT